MRTRDKLHPVDDYYDRLRLEIGWCGKDTLIRAVEAATEAMSSALSSNALRSDLHDAIAPTLRDAVLAGARRPRVELRELQTTVAQATAVRAGVVAEIVQLFLARLSGALTPALRQRLRDDLGDEWSALLIDPSPSSYRRSRSSPAFARGDRLVDARPGSMRPLADARPRPGGHVHSIANNDDPHRDTKLSSSRGMTPERYGRTLAMAEPGAGRRSLSDYEK